MKKATILQLALLLSGLVPASHQACTTECQAAQSPDLNKVRERIGKIILNIINKPITENPYDILRALIYELQTYLQCRDDAQVARLCLRLQQAVNTNEKNAYSIISSITEHCNSGVLPDGVCERLQTIPRARQLMLVSSFNKALERNTASLSSEASARRVAQHLLS